MEVNLARLRVFLAVADALHFGRAAELLHLSQPSVSQQVARLERQVGCRLFVREARSVRLTPEGEDLVRRAGPAVRQLDEAIEGFTRAHEPGGPLRVGLLFALAGWLVPAALAAVVGPGFEVSLHESGLGQMAQRLRVGELDVGFCIRTTEPGVLEGLQCVVLDKRPVVVAVPSGRVEAPPWPWADLAELPWIMPSAARHYYRDNQVAAFARRGLEVRVVGEAATLAGQLALVAAGVGCTFAVPWSPFPPGVLVGTMVDGDDVELVAVHRPGELPAQAHALVNAVAATAVECGRVG